jgi:hypothetical protein
MSEVGFELYNKHKGYVTDYNRIKYPKSFEEQMLYYVKVYHILPDKNQI